MAYQVLEGAGGEHTRLPRSLKWLAAVAALPLIPLLIWGGTEVLMALDGLISTGRV
jgi:hypothetical protein